MNKIPVLVVCIGGNVYTYSPEGADVQIVDFDNINRGDSKTVLPAGVGFEDLVEQANAQDGVEFEANKFYYISYEIGMDRNGNKILKVKNTNKIKGKNSFTIQTLGNLPATQRIQKGMVIEHLPTTKEVMNYLEKCGTPRQKKLFYDL